MCTYIKFYYSSHRLHPNLSFPSLHISQFLPSHLSQISCFPSQKSRPPKDIHRIQYEPILKTNSRNFMPWLVINSEWWRKENLHRIESCVFIWHGFRKLGCLYVIQENKTVPTQQHLFDSTTAPPLLHSNGRNWKDQHHWVCGKYQLHRNLKYILDKEALVWWEEFGLWSYKELNLNSHLVTLKHFFIQWIKLSTACNRQSMDTQ